MKIVSRTINLVDVDIESLSFEIVKKVSKVDYIALINHSTGELKLECKDTWDNTDDTELDDTLSAHDALIDHGFVIEDLLPQGSKEPINTVNYKTALSTKLHPDRTFLNGFVTQVKYYKTHNMDGTLEDQVLQVDIDYESKDDAVHESGKTVSKRTTTRRWNRKDGTLDESEKKVTEKFYPHITESRAEGRRRRSNIFNIASKDIVILLMFTETAGDQESAEQLGLAIVETYSGEFNNFTKVAGVQKLIDVITSDSVYTWLDNVVPLNASVQYLVPKAVVGETIRNYINRSFSGAL